MKQIDKWKAEMATIEDDLSKRSHFLSYSSIDRKRNRIARLREMIAKRESPKVTK
jgi:hypothetical protein